MASIKINITNANKKLSLDVNPTTTKSITYKGSEVNQIYSDIDKAYVWCRPYTLTIGDKSTGVASFTVTRTSTLEPTASTGILSSGDTIYHGDVLTVSATASNHYTLNSYTTKYTVSGNLSISSPSAYQHEYLLTWTIGSNVKSVTIAGTTYASNSSKYIAKGTSVTCTAIGNTGYEYNNASANKTLVMNSNQTYSPSFNSSNATRYTLTLTKNTGITTIGASRSSSPYANAATGSIATSAGSITVYYGDVIVCSAALSSGYSLNSGSSLSKTITITGSYTYAPSTTRLTWSLNMYLGNYINSYKYRIKSSSGTYGSWNTSTGNKTITVDYAETVEVTINSMYANNTGNTDEYTYTYTDSYGTKTFSYSSSAQSTTVSATRNSTKNKYTLTINKYYYAATSTSSYSSTGTFIETGTSSLEYGSTYNETISKTGYVSQTVSGTITGNVTKNVYLIPNKYTLTATISNGTINYYSDSGYSTAITTAYYGSTAYVKFTPTSRYGITLNNTWYYNSNPYKGSKTISAANVGTFNAEAIVYTYSISFTNGSGYYNTSANPTTNGTITGIYANRGNAVVYYRTTPNSRYGATISNTWYYNGNYYASSVSCSNFTFTDSTKKATYTFGSWSQITYTVTNNSITGGTVTWSPTTGTYNLLSSSGSTYTITNNTGYNLPSTSTKKITSFTYSDSAKTATYSSISDCILKTYTITISKDACVGTIYYKKNGATSWSTTTSSSITDVNYGSTLYYYAVGANSCCSVNTYNSTSSYGTVSNITSNQTITLSGTWSPSVSVNYGTISYSTDNGSTYTSTKPTGLAASKSIYVKCVYTNSTYEYNYSSSNTTWTNVELTATNPAKTFSQTRTTKQYSDYTGTWTNCTVKMYSDSARTKEISSSNVVNYGATIYYTVTPNEHYYCNLDSISNVGKAYNNSFTLSSSYCTNYNANGYGTISRAFTAVMATYTVTYTTNPGIRYLYYKKNGATSYSSITVDNVNGASGTITGVNHGSSFIWYAAGISSTNITPEVSSDSPVTTNNVTSNFSLTAKVSSWSPTVRYGNATIYYKTSNDSSYSTTRPTNLLPTVTCSVYAIFNSNTYAYIYSASGQTSNTITLSPGSYGTTFSQTRTNRAYTSYTGTWTNCTVKMYSDSARTKEISSSNPHYPASSSRVYFTVTPNSGAYYNNSTYTNTNPYKFDVDAEIYASWSGSNNGSYISTFNCRYPSINISAGSYVNTVRYKVNSGPWSGDLSSWSTVACLGDTIYWEAVSYSTDYNECTATNANYDTYVNYTFSGSTSGSFTVTNTSHSLTINRTRTSSTSYDYHTYWNNINMMYNGSEYSGGGIGTFTAIYHDGVNYNNHTLTQQTNEQNYYLRYGGYIQLSDIIPAPDYYIESVTCDSSNWNSSSWKLTVYSGGSNININMNKYWYLTLSIGSNGYIVVNGTKYTSSTTLAFEQGKSASYSCGANSGYVVSSSSGSGTATSDATISVTTVIEWINAEYTINTSNYWYDISGNLYPNTILSPGESYTYTINCSTSISAPYVLINYDHLAGGDINASITSRTSSYVKVKCTAVLKRVIIKSITIRGTYYSSSGGSSGT